MAPDNTPQTGEAAPKPARPYVSVRRVPGRTPDSPVSCVFSVFPWHCGRKSVPADWVPVGFDGSGQYGRGRIEYRPRLRVWEAQVLIGTAQYGRKSVPIHKILRTKDFFTAVGFALAYGRDAVPGVKNYDALYYYGDPDEAKELSVPKIAPLRKSAAGPEASNRSERGVRTAAPEGHQDAARPERLGRTVVPHQGSMVKTTLGDDFDFLAWVERACLIPSDLHADLVAAGVDERTARMFANSDAVRLKRSIVKLYQDYGRTDKAAFDAMMKMFRRQYEKARAATCAVTAGNVYRCKGGGKTAYWVVLAVVGRTVCLLGVDHRGVPTSATAYGIHVFDGYNALFKPRPKVGFCGDIAALGGKLKILLEDGRQIG